MLQTELLSPFLSLLLLLALAGLLLALAGLLLTLAGLLPALAGLLPALAVFLAPLHCRCVPGGLSSDEKLVETGDGAMAQGDMAGVEDVWWYVVATRKNVCIRPFPFTSISPRGSSSNPPPPPPWVQRAL